MSKKLEICLIVFFILLTNLYAKPVHEKVWVGMSLRSFNTLNLGTFIPDQSRKSALTRYGLVHLDSASMKRYFPLNDSIWKGVMVTMKNNTLSEYTLQGSIDTSHANLKDVFSDLLRMHGVSFSLNDYRSLSKKGYSVIWHNNNQLVSMNITIAKDQTCSISLKKAFTQDGNNRVQQSEKAILALEPIFGNGFHKLDPFQFADGDSSNTQKGLDNQLDSLLTN